MTLPLPGRLVAAVSVGTLALLGTTGTAAFADKGGNGNGNKGGCAEGEGYAPGTKSCEDSHGAREDKKEVKAGEKDTVGGNDSKPGGHVDGEGHSLPFSLGSTVADSTGHWSLTFTVPTGLPAGTHHLVFSFTDKQGHPSVTTLPLLVTGASGKTGTGTGTGMGSAQTGPAGTGTVRKGVPGAASGGAGTSVNVAGVSLPRTGTDIAVLALAGAGLVGVGGAALTTGRRRRQQPAA